VAMPSIHFGATFLLVIALCRSRWPWKGFAIVTAILMGVSLVYLGEHLVIDKVVGAAYAGIGWWLAPSVAISARQTLPNRSINRSSVRSS